MTTINKCFGVHVQACTVLMSLLVVGCSVSHAQQPPDPWARLKSRSAWIILGHVYAVSGQWADLPAYEIVGRSITGDRRMPGVTDILRLTHERPLYIRDFKNAGERKVLEPLTMPLEEADLTDGLLLPATHVVVRALYRDTGQLCDTLCTVWALVGPEQPR